MTKNLALIQNEPEEILAVFQDGAGRIRIPLDQEAWVHAPQDGWHGLGFHVAAIGPVEIPAGKRRISTGIDGVELVDGEPVWILEDVPPPPIPGQVSAAQAKLALDAAGALDDVEAMIAAHPVRAVRIWFADANIWERSHPYVSALGAEMSLDDDAIDALFAAASLY